MWAADVSEYGACSDVAGNGLRDYLESALTIYLNSIRTG